MNALRSSLGSHPTRNLVLTLTVTLLAAGGFAGGPAMSFGAPAASEAASSPHGVPGPTAVVALPLTASTSLQDRASKVPAIHPPQPANAPAASFLPPHALNIANCSTTAPVIPGCGYYKEAAPMGIGDFGVSGWATPIDYDYSTTIFMGVFDWSSLSIANGTDDSFTVQLNVVLNFVAGAGAGQNYSFWIQDVAVPTDSTANTLDMAYENNIWNFSAAAGGGGYVPIPKGTLKGNGTVEDEEYYYDEATGTGSGDTLAAPNDFELIVISTIIDGYPVVRFCYKDPTMTAVVCYDTVAFTFAKQVDLDRNFLVDGYTMNPIGLFEDAELTLGGPGGGSYTVMKATTNAAMTLDRWTGHNFEATPSAWNFGDDTAESISSTQSIFSQDGSGSPLTAQLNGTTRDATPEQAWRTNEVGGLDATLPSTPNGTLTVLHRDTKYQFGYANLTLIPGTYPVWDNGTTTSQFLGDCTIVALQTLQVSNTNVCPGGVSAGPTIASFSAAPNPVNEGVSTTFNVSAGGGTGALSFDYTGLPSGCLTQDTPQFSCTPTEAGTFAVTVFVNDSGSGHATATTSLVVNVPPITIASFSATPNPVVLPEGTNFSVSASTTGGGTLSVSYAGLPTGCASANLDLLACVPTVPGTFSVTVTVASSAGGSVSQTLTLVVQPPAAPTASLQAVYSHGLPLFVDNPVAFDTTTSGYLGPTATYNYSGLPGGCTNQSVAYLDCTPDVTGSFTVGVVVRNAYGGISTPATATVVVEATPPAITSVTFAASPSTVDVGSSTSLSVTVVGGTSPYSYTFTNLPSGCEDTANVATFTCSPTAAGTFAATVEVQDTYGRVGWANTTIVVNNAPATGLGQLVGGVPLYDWLLIAGMIVAAVVVLALVLRHGRQRGGAPEAPAAPAAVSPLEPVAQPGAPAPLPPPAGGSAWAPPPPPS